MFGKMFKAVTDVVTSPLDVTDAILETVGLDGVTKDLKQVRDEVSESIQDEIEDFEDNILR